MRDELVKETDVTATVDPTYKQAIDDFDNRKKVLDKTLKNKEERKKPVFGKKEDKLDLEESLFEDTEEVLTESKRMNEDISNDRAKEILDALIDNLCEVDGVRETIKNLIDLSVDRNELVAMNFDKDEVEAVFDSLDEECKKKISEALIEVEDEDVVEMLIDRLIKYWHPANDEVYMYEKMYQNYVDNGVFDGQKISISDIVDNDWVNYCDIVSDGDDYFEECKKAYAEGDYEVYDENEKYIGTIESVNIDDNPTKFLIRLG